MVMHKSTEDFNDVHYVFTLDQIHHPSACKVKLLCAWEHFRPCPTNAINDSHGWQPNSNPSSHGASL